MDKSWSTLKKLIYLQGERYGTPAPPYSGAWLKFYNEYGFYISFTNPIWVKMEWSADGKTWTEWDGSAIHGAEIYLRGEENGAIGGNAGRHFVIMSDQPDDYVNCDGNIMMLVDYKLASYYDMAATETEFADLFLGCTTLATPPRLPATTLIGRAYVAMFEGCTALKYAPELPAATLTEECYAHMFAGCTSLEYAPHLKADTIKRNSYVSMFSGCTALKTAPDIYASVIGEEGCASMFYGCASLQTPPMMPNVATIGRAGCVRMFKGCKPLTSIPALYATDLGATCYGEMFSGTEAVIMTTRTALSPYPFRVPATGTASGSPNATGDMFSAGEDVAKSPTLNTTYYTNIPTRG